jgi:hypothetical protein
MMYGMKSRAEKYKGGADCIFGQSLYAVSNLSRDAQRALNGYTTACRIYLIYELLMLAVVGLHVLFQARALSDRFLTCLASLWLPASLSS